MAKVKPDKKLRTMITGEFRVSYPHLFEPQGPPDAKKLKFSLTMLVPKDRKEPEKLIVIGLSPEGEPRSLKQIIRQAKIAQFGEDKKNWPAGLSIPVKDGDDPEYEGKEGYKGHWVIKAASEANDRPSVVDRDMGVITDPAIVYPGCYARASIIAYVWKPYMGKQGINFNLNHVQKIRDGKSFGGKVPVEKTFTVIESDDEDSASDDGDF